MKYKFPITESSSDAHLLADFIASAQVSNHCDYFDAPPSDIMGMSLNRAHRSLAAHRGWARVLTDRMDTKV